MSKILRAENLIKSFNEREEVLHGINLELVENTFNVILGQSGSGKSTLLNILSGLIRPTAGKVYLDQIDITNLSDRDMSKIKRDTFGYVFQNYLLLQSLNVEENIRIGNSNQNETISFEYLVDKLNLKNLLKKFPSQISGGEQQRIAIARAVIKKPKFLFCDEVTGALDELNSKKVVELLHSIKKDFGITIIFITHNASIASTADRILTLKNGLLVKDEQNLNPILASDMIW